MIPKECIHFNKANRIIKSFVNSAVNVSCKYEIRPLRSKEVNYFIFGSIEDGEVIIFVPNWKKADFTKDLGGKCFRADFVSRCPAARGFSDVTLSLLHELGHTMTKIFVPPMNKEIDEYNKAVENLTDMKEVNKLYFALTDEHMATDWAIEWLQNRNNRRLAKNFEKQFATCFIKG